MRRRMPVVAVLGACGALVAATLSWIAVVGSRPQPHAAEDPAVPADLTWSWVSTCVDWRGSDNFGLTYFSIDDDGVATVELGFVDEQGEITVDPESTAEANACIGARRIDPGSASRAATAAERALIYDWALRWQAPCLTARGFNLRVAQRRDFMDTDGVVWFLLDRYSGDQTIPFDTLLEARLACPPMPPFLAAQGVGW